MLTGLRLHSPHLSNNSPTSVFDMYGCEEYKEGKYIWLFFNTLFFALGFPASIAILWQMFKAHRGGSPFTPNDFFILNVSIMDGVFLFFIPLGLMNNFVWMYWPFETFFNGVYALNTCGRPLMMACICLDGYMAVVHPITYHKRKSLTPRVVMAGIVWILTIASGIAYYSFVMLFYTIFSILPFIVAMVIIAICDSLILHSLIKSDLGRNIHPQKQRAIHTLTNSLVISVLSYLPPVLLIVVVKPQVSEDIFICSIGYPMTLNSCMGSTLMSLLHLKSHGQLDCFRVGCCRKVLSHKSGAVEALKHFNFQKLSFSLQL